MAISDVNKLIKGLYFDIEAEVLRKRSNEAFAHIIRINFKTFAAAFAGSINASWKSNGNTKDIAKVSNIETIVGKIGSMYLSIGSMDTAGQFTNQVQEGDEGYDMNIILYSPSQRSNTKNITELTRQFRLDIWNEWKVLGKPELSDTTNTKKGNYGEQLAVDTGISHDKETNVAKASLVDFLEGVDPGTGGPLGTESIGIADLVLARLHLNWKRAQNFQGDGKDIWVVEGELAGENPPWLKGTDQGKLWDNKVLDVVKQLVLDAANDPNDIMFSSAMKGSKPFEDKVLDQVVNKITKPYKRLRDKKGRFVKVKMTGIPKKPKNHKQKGSQKPSRRTKRGSKGVKVLPSTLKASLMGKEKGTASKSTDSAIQLAKLRKYINSRLPAEVRRNMGSPALTNQTGRFSNSVQLLNLMEGKNTVMANYTYLLSPYATFENTGKKRWPVSYNPKTLIAKSIRNLAQGRIKQNLTLRRV